MANFKPGDRVVCINPDTSRAVNAPLDATFEFPDGPPRKDTVYLVDALGASNGGSLWINGLRVLCNGTEIPWHAGRWRKVQPLKNRADQRKQKRELVETG